MSRFPTTPPLTEPLPQVALARHEVVTYPSGLRVILIEDRRFPLLHVHLGLDAGARHELPSRAGLSSATAALLTEGTASRTSLEIAEQLADIGGSLSAASEEDCLLISAKSLSSDSETLLDLLSDVALRPSFPAEEVDLYRRNRIQQLLDERSRAGVIAAERVVARIFGDHPYGRLLPSLAFLESLSRDSLVEYHQTRFTPAGAFLILLGDLPDRALLHEWITRCFGSWSGASQPAAPLPDLPAPHRSLTLVDRPGSVQAEILMGRLAVNRRHPDHFPLVLASGVLGTGASSRLFHHIRETKGYAYSVGSRFDRFRDAGAASVYLQVRPDALGAALSDTIAELHRLHREAVSEEELERVKNFICGNFVLGLETHSGMISQISALYVNQLDSDYLDRFPARVREVSSDQVRAAAQRYFDPATAAIVVVGEASQLRAELEPFGITETVSAAS